MDPIRMARIDRTAFPCVVADGEHVIKTLPRELIHRLRAMPRDVDPDLFHYGDGFESNLNRLRSGALDIETLAGIVPQGPFGHLTAGGISGAEDQHPLGHSYLASLLLRMGNHDRRG